METILVLTHVDDSGAALTKASLEAVTAGLELSRQISAPLTIGIIGLNAEAAATAVAATGARLLAVSGEAFARHVMHRTPQVAKLCAARRRPASFSPREARGLCELRLASRIGWAAASIPT